MLKGHTRLTSLLGTLFTVLLRDIITMARQRKRARRETSRSALFSAFLRGRKVHDVEIRFAEYYRTGPGDFERPKNHKKSKKKKNTFINDIKNDLEKRIENRKLSQKMRNTNRYSFELTGFHIRGSHLFRVVFTIYDYSLKSVHESVFANRH